MPSAHVWSNFLSPAFPQLLNQAPPRAQQLLLPDFFVVTHLGHTTLLLAADKSVVTNVSVIDAGVDMNKHTDSDVDTVNARTECHVG